MCVHIYMCDCVHMYVFICASNLGVAPEGFGSHERSNLAPGSCGPQPSALSWMLVLDQGLGWGLVDPAALTTSDTPTPAL